MEQAGAMSTIYQEEVYSIATPVTVILDKPWKDIQLDQRHLLAKILQAVKLSPEGVRIIHMPSFDVSDLREKPKRMIAFMAPPKGLALYEVILTGEASMVFSDNLETLVRDDAAKRNLWNVLKTFFPG
jgi:hypothetical protein